MISFRSERGQWIAAGLLLLLFAVLAWIQRVPSITTANDDAWYILLSRSLRDGGYHSVHIVGAPVHTMYPPVFPALLAAVSSVGGESIGAFVALNIALTVAALALVFAVAKRHWPPVVALGALAIAVASGPLQGIAGTVMSEPTFLFFTALTLWLLADPARRTSHVALACACAALAALTRTAGATVVVAVAVWLVRERRWRAAAALSGRAAVAALGTALWRRASRMPAPAAEYLSDAMEVPAGGSANPIVILAHRVMTNATQYAQDLLWSLSFPTIEGTPADNFAWLAIVVVALSVGLVALYRRWRVAVLFILLYGALLLAWAWPIGRFLLPVVPLAALAFLIGVHAMTARRWAGMANGIVAVLAAVLVTTGLLRGRDEVSTRAQCNRDEPLRSPACFNRDQLSFFEASRYVGERTTPSAIVMSSKEATFHYLTHRRIVPLDSANALPPEHAAQFLRRSGVSHILLSHLSADDVVFARRLIAACRHLDVERHFPTRTTVFRVARTTVADGQACAILRAYARNAGRFRPQVF
ncbi:MAG: glycosyltransferase family 39 protein [Gemmatimonadaceae bacterium]